VGETGNLSFLGYSAVSDQQDLPSPQNNAAQRGFLGDYSSIVASTVPGFPGDQFFYPIWSDTRNGSSADPDEDIFIGIAANDLAVCIYIGPGSCPSLPFP
jgi:hypothetical protein